MEKSVLICGAGYVGSALGLSLGQSNFNVTALKRSVPSQPIPKITNIVCDLLSVRELVKLPGSVDEIVFCIAPSRHEEQDCRCAYVESLGNLTRHYATLNKKPRIIFTSSTGVYGQDDGSIVDESSETNPPTFSGRIVLEGEQTLKDSGFPWVILRLGGIYGPGRMKMLQRLRSGENTDQLSVRELDTYTNRIHLSDCVGVIRFVIESELSGATINCVDERSATRREIISHFTTTPLPVVADCYGKRVSSAYLRSLGYRFAFPDFSTVDYSASQPSST